MEDYYVLGIEPVVYDFDDKSGRHIHTEGFNIYGTQNIENGYGMRSERLYFTKDKLVKSGFSSTSDVKGLLEKAVSVKFNRYLKPQEIRVLA